MEVEWLPEAKPLLKVAILRYEAALDAHNLDAIAIVIDK